MTIKKDISLIQTDTLENFYEVVHEEMQRLQTVSTYYPFGTKIVDVKLNFFINKDAENVYIACILYEYEEAVDV